LRRSPLRGGLVPAALLTTTIGAGAVSAPALAQTQGTAGSAPIAQISTVGVGKTRLNVRAGRRALVAGTVLPRAAGRVASLQVRRGDRWRTIDRDRTGTAGRYRLRDRRTAPGSLPVRVHVRGGGHRAKRRLGRLNVYRIALASWFGPGFYGQRTGCGGTLRYGQLGVAHKTLPCGTKVTLRHHGRRVRVPVIDRGPYVGAREYDLTAATARRLGFNGARGILTTR
jgi:rare lipoprotein A